MRPEAVQSQALPKFDDLHLFTGFCAPFRLYGTAKTMLSSLTESRLTADAGSVAAAIVALGPGISEVRSQHREGIPT